MAELAAEEPLDRSHGAKAEGQHRGGGSTIRDWGRAKLGKQALGRHSQCDQDCEQYCFFHTVLLLVLG